MLFVQGKELCFRYKEATENLIENISFQIAPSAKIGMTGKNGCGKTTLFNLILGSLNPSNGLLYVRENLKIGYLAQEIPLDNSLVLEEFLWPDKVLYSYKKILENYERNEINLSETELINYLSYYDTEGGYLFEAELGKIISQFCFAESNLSRKIACFSGGEKTRIALAK